MEMHMKIGQDFPAGPCRLCGTASRRLVADRGRGGAPLETALCTGCGLVCHAEIPDEAAVSDFYATRYRLEYKGGFTPKRKHALRALRGAMARARRLAPLLPAHARVLDIGASSGEFTFVMREAGFTATGLEPNWGYAEFARREYAVDISQGGWDAPEFPREALHLVTMNHVMEHLTDPWAGMRRLHQALAPEGLLFIEVPNLAGIRKQLTNTFHAAHIWNFTPETLIAAAWQAGFTPRAGENLGHTSIVFRKRGPGDASPAGADATHAAALWRQMTQEQSRAAYLFSAAPITRRWQRLLRNISEHVATRRHATIRAMGEALLDRAALEHASPWAGRHGWRVGGRDQPTNSAASRAKA
jgi:2-polyprenyl-3-methyl-5-hydroxy-6-metoxy-1,4-benzoquinol methylase